MDDFTKKRAKLAQLSDEELKSRFWDLADQVVQPLVDLARTHTSPSIERSVVLRMGFSSLEANAIVNQCVQRDLLQRGAGGMIYRIAQKQGLSIREAGQKLAQGELWETIEEGDE